MEIFEEEKNLFETFGKLETLRNMWIYFKTFGKHCKVLFVVFFASGKHSEINLKTVLGTFESVQLD